METKIFESNCSELSLNEMKQLSGGIWPMVAALAAVFMAGYQLGKDLAN